MDRPSWVPDGIDLTRASAARVYDYFLGGAHNFAVDRELAEQVIRITPDVGDTMRANRAFLRRAVRFLAAQGIRQFLDIGAGIPTVGNVHEVAQETAPDSRVVYVDVDPVAVAHSRAMLGTDGRVAMLCIDLREPDRIVAEARATKLIDFREPVALILLGVVHFLPDSDDPADIIARLRDAVPDGSYLALSHVTYEDQPPEVLRAFSLSRQTSAELVLRSHAEITGYFNGFKLVEPGVVHIPLWRPDDPHEPGERPERIGAFAGVGRKN
jgi:hypothetical protein